MDKIVEQMAREREERAKAAEQALTITEAINEAQWLRKTPDGILDPLRARKTIDALLSAIESSPCFLKAKLKGEEVFVLRQQDRAAPFAIRYWAEAAERKGCPGTKVEEANRISVRWGRQSPNVTKWPD